MVRFAFDFLVGDDWRLALGAVILVAFVALLVSQGINAWWLAPPAIPALLLSTHRP